MRGEYPAVVCVKVWRWATMISVFMLMLSGANAEKGYLMNDGSGLSSSQWYDELKSPASEAWIIFGSRERVVVIFCIQ